VSMHGREQSDSFLRVVVGFAAVCLLARGPWANLTAWADGGDDRAGCLGTVISPQEKQMPLRLARNWIFWATG